MADSARGPEGQAAYVHSVTDDERRTVDRARAAMRLLPLLSDIDKDKGAQAVMDALKAIGVVTYSPENDRLIFRAVEVSAFVLHREIEKRL